MFNGLITHVGVLKARTMHSHGGALLQLEAPSLPQPTIGESICCDGACLSVSALCEDGFEVELSPETLALTGFGTRRLGARVNLERALRLGDPIDGHLTSGHVDALGRVAALTAQGGGKRLDIEAPVHLRRLVAVKGSVAVNGVALTVNGVDEPTPPHAQGFRFWVTLIPLTLARTNLGDLKVNDKICIEVDMLARYCARWLSLLPPDRADNP